MKVKELIKQLSNLDQELEVLCYSEDEQLISGKSSHRILEIDDVTVIVAEKQRDEIPQFSFNKSPLSQKIALINVTSEF